MENQNNTVESMLAQAQDDAAMSNQEPGSLAEVLGADDPSAQEPQHGEQPSATETTEEPGWFKRRMEKHDQKLNAEFQRQLQEMRDGYEAQLAPLREAGYRQEAEQLVADGEFKSIDRALEYVRLKAGAPAEAPKETQKTRDAHGRFVKADDETQRYAQTLVAQAEVLKDATGVDVMELYNTDPSVKQKIISREWSFADVYKNAQPQRRSEPPAPAPVRSPNGFSIGNMNISRMSESQFDKLDDLLAKGGKIDMTDMS